MPKILHILIIEDDPGDVRLVVEQIKEAGYEPIYEVVNKKEDISRALKNRKWDIILSDFHLPGFDAFDVLKVVKKSNNDIPLIILTGFLGEDSAIDLMRSGAQDFITKDNISRLVPAIERELKQAYIRIDRNRKTLELDEQKKLFSTILESNADLIAIKGRDFTYQAVNLAFCKFLSLDRKNIIGKNDFDIFPLEKAETYQRFDARVLILNETQVYEDKISTNSGEEWFSIVKSPILDISGMTIGILSIWRNITQLKITSEALRENEERYRRLIEVSPDGIIVHDDEQIIFLNTSAQKMLAGKTIDDIVSKKFIDFIHPDYKDLESKHIKNVLKFGEPAELIEEKLVRTDGSSIDVEITSVPILWQNHNAIQTMIRDITKRKQAEETLFKSQKLESLGILAGGIGHDFNNLLTAILLKNTLAAKGFQKGKDISNLFNEIEQIVYRAKGLAQQLLTFAEGGAPIIKPCSIADIISQTVKFILSGSNIDYQFDFPKDLYSAKADENQISQVIQNLVLNAQQSMPEGGTINISAKNVYLDENNIFSLKKGEYIEISLSDTGTGIPRKYLSKIFDPYFTTKEYGTGLGLSITYSIIKRHKGHISVESEIGKGTKFLILLPAEKSKVEIKQEKINKAQKGTGKILIMDDEIDILKSLSELLQSYGYKVDTAEDGIEAVEKYVSAQKKGEPFDLVILDLTVQGGMGGKDTIAKLKQIDPNVKAIVSSGYSNDTILAEYYEYGFSGAIKKPYKIDDLNEIISKTI